jgi:hypothetical protein
VLLDDFNRPDSTDMGPNWNEISADFQIISGRAHGMDLGSMIYVGQTSNSVSVDVYSTSSADDYGAIVLGFANTSNSLYIKIQSQDDIQGFEAVGFYFGDNGTNNGAWSESFFDPGAFSNFHSAHMNVALAGNVVTLSLDTDFDSVYDIAISRGSVPLGLLGSGIGLGGWTSAAGIDNFSIGDVPEPTTIALWALGAIGLPRLRRRMKHAV